MVRNSNKGSSPPRRPNSRSSSGILSFGKSYGPPERPVGGTASPRKTSPAGSKKDQKKT